MFRHTVADRLRAVGVYNEDIGAILGHAGSVQTANYGNQHHLGREAATLAKLDYGFDVLEALGGPFNSTLHRV